MQLNGLDSRTVYDTDREEMFKNNVKSLGKVICSFSVENGDLILHEMLQIK